MNLNDGWKQANELIDHYMDHDLDDMSFDTLAKIASIKLAFPEHFNKTSSAERSESKADQLMQDKEGAFDAYMTAKSKYQTDKNDANKRDMLKALDKMLSLDQEFVSTIHKSADTMEEKKALKEKFIKIVNSM